MCEGTTIHSVQGITVGAKKQVKRIGISLGEPSMESRSRGLSYVAQSRPETTDDFAYIKPVGLDRVHAIGKGSGADSLKSKMAAFEAHQSADADRLIAEGLYEPLLEWAEAFALDVHGIRAPWHARAPPPPAADAVVPPSQDAQMADAAEEVPPPSAPSSSALGKRPAPIPPTRSPYFATASAAPPGDGDSEEDDGGIRADPPPMMLSGLVQFYDDSARRGRQRRGESSSA